uniref:Efflux RND transporter periplasmic adaptor subunit n=1 Tax=Roseihalotalea indica TaxID=2867963 RepID=A0AA49GLY9_9BACT|nr:efflux RND transporter periplasmic adaptor subunit [Tunicatimonas sp. TK19036]
MLKNSWQGFITAILIIPLEIFLQSCTGDSKGNTLQTAQVQEYPVKKLSYQSVVTNKSYPATVEGIQTVELRPRVEGYLEEIYVDEGARVKKGQLLFRINSDEFNEQVNSAKANVAVAQANLNAAQMEVEKQRPLVERDIVGEYALTSAQYSQESAKAALEQAKASLQNARTNLNYTLIKSPVDGIIGIIPYRIGSLVNSNIAEPLTFISDISKVRVYFSVNEKDFLTLSRGVLEREKGGQIENQQEVKLVLVDGREYDEEGVIDAVSGLINSSTGSATLRATFDNPDGLLRSGSSATVKIPSEMDSALVVPQAATYEIQNKRFIYVVNDSNQVEPQEITVTPDDNGQNFIVLSGLEPTDRVVTEGINSLKSDMKIAPVEAD